MTIDDQVAAHYQHADLLAAIEAGLAKQGISPKTATIHDLAPVDEFHIGGRIASAHFLDQLEIQSDMNLVDIGCGLGGSARFVAATYGAHVTGIDLTPEYVEVGQALCRWVGLAEHVDLQQGSALSMPFSNETFDGAYMMHVGMNIEDKRKLFGEVYRVLKNGAQFGIYDIMRTSSDEVVYPVPWATTSETSWLASPTDYNRDLESVNFEVITRNNQRDFALEFFRTIKETNRAKGGPPPLGLHTLMQQTTSQRVGNMVANIAANLIAPVEVVAVKR